MHEFKEKVKEICDLKDKLLCWTKEECEKGKGAVDTKEMGEVVDMVKDLAKAEKSCWEAAYYMSIVEAMKEAEESDDGAWRMGYDNWRYASGRFAPKGHGHRTGYIPDPHHLDPMMYETDGMMNPRMGYTGTVPTHTYGEHFDHFKDAKRHYTQTGDKSSRQAMDSHAQQHVEETTETIREIWSDASPELRKKMKQDFTKLIGEMEP